jgi:futalosine hydrolase
MIALVAAVPIETELLRRYLAPCEVRSCGRRDLFRGTLCGIPVALMHSGVGKANAAAAVSILLETLNPSMVIGTGVAGAFPQSGLTVGDLALATDEIYGDEGALTPQGFLDMKELGLALVQRSGRRLFNTFPLDGSTLDLIRPILTRYAAAAGCQLGVGPFVTVSTGSGTDASAREMASRTGGICENMEGAALAQICALYGASFIEIRGISNLTGDRDLSLWNVRKGAEAAQCAIRDLFHAWRDVQDRA